MRVRAIMIELDDLATDHASCRLDQFDELNARLESLCLHFLQS